MFLCEKYLKFVNSPILMIILEMREKTLTNLCWCTYKITHTSDAINFRLLNFSKHQSLGQIFHYGIQFATLR